MSTPPAAPPCLLAVSVGLPKTVPWQGEEISTGIYKSPLPGRTRVRAHALGLDGDGQADLSVHGVVDKAVYAYDESSIRYWAESLGRPDIPAGSFGENLTLRGCREDEVSVGDVFEIGDACFEISQPRQPCFKIGIRFDDPAFPKRFLKSGRVGFYLRVLEAGEIAAGDSIRFIHRDPGKLRIQELVAIWTDKQATTAMLDRALSIPALAGAWRAPLEKRRARFS